MQSVLSMTRSSLARQGGSILFSKPTQISLAPCHHYRHPFLISNGGGQGSRLIWTRRLLSQKSDASGTSFSTNRQSFSSLFEWYSKKLDTHPIMTKCITGGCISSIGSVLAQLIGHQQQQQQEENGNKELLHGPFEVDLVQVSRFVFLNVIFVAPVLHQWYNFVNRAIPGRSLSRVFQRTFADEFLFSPIYIPCFLTMLWKLEGISSKDIWRMMKSELPNIIVTEWIMWVPTMIVTFRYVPVKFQVMVVNVVGVVWNTFLAYAANKAHSSHSEVEYGERKEKDQ